MIHSLLIVLNMLYPLHSYASEESDYKALSQTVVRINIDTYNSLIIVITIEPYLKNRVRQI